LLSGLLHLGGLFQQLLLTNNALLLLLLLLLLPFLGCHGGS
jgi:hypothetical protein